MVNKTIKSAHSYIKKCAESIMRERHRSFNFQCHSCVRAIYKIAVIVSIIACLEGPAFAQDTTQTFKPYGVIGGLFFGDFAYKIKADSLKRGNVEYSNIDAPESFFNIRRLYISYDYFISPKFTSQIVLTYEGQTAATSTRNIFIRYMNVRWKNVFKRTDFVFGQQATPIYNFFETTWGLRYIEKTIADMRGIAPASDLGFSVQGRLNEKGNLNYNFTIANGSGLRPENDKYKRLYATFFGKLFNEKLWFDVDYSYEATAPSAHQSKHLYKVGVAYKTDKIAIGAEAFDDALKHQAGTIRSVTNDTVMVNESSVGYSVFLTKRFSKQFSCFIRYDKFNPDTKFNSGNHYVSSYNVNSENFFAAGLDYQPVESVHIIPNLWYDHFHNKQIKESAALTQNADVVPRLTVYVVFK
jgi:hypothetical protein